MNVIRLLFLGLALLCVPRHAKAESGSCVLGLREPAGHSRVEALLRSGCREIITPPSGIVSIRSSIEIPRGVRLSFLSGSRWEIDRGQMVRIGGELFLPAEVMRQQIFGGEGSVEFSD